MTSYTFFLTKLRPFILHIIAALAVFIAALSSFIALVDEVREGDTLAIDQALLTAINKISTEPLDTFFVIATHSGGIAAVSLLTIGLVTILIRKKWYYRALFVASNMIGAGLINLVLKLIFGRPRPDLWQQLVTETSFSFPSGHAVASSALAISLIVIMWHTKWRNYALFLGGLYVLIIGLSRLYLGVHYPSDIIGGWLVSACWIVIVAGSLTAHRLRRKDAPNS